MALDEELVTVVVPSFNHAQYVQTCLQSILSQDYPSIELIVVDDGSTDGSRALLTELAERHGFRLILQANAGIAATLNRGVREGRGEYVALCASDDFWLPGKLGTQVRYLREHREVAGCSGNVVRVDETGNPLPGQRPVEPRRHTFQDFLLSKYYFPAPAVMLRRSAFEEVGGFDARFKMEDWPMWLKLTARGFYLDLLPESLVAYRVHSMNAHKRVRAMVEDRFAVIEQYANSEFYDSAIDELVVRAFFELASTEKRAAVRYALPALRAAPRDWRTWLAFARLALSEPHAEALTRSFEWMVRATAAWRNNSRSRGGL